MRPSSELEAVGDKLITLAENQRLWPFPENGEASLLLQEFHMEWAVHYQATLETLILAHRAMIVWYQKSEQSTFQNKLVSLASSSIQSGALALEADKFEQFFDLSLSIVESASKALGLAPLVVVFEGHGLLSKIMKLLKLGKSEFSALDSLLPLAEEAMERMLLMSLWVDSQVSAITAPSSRIATAQVKSIAELKAPIIGRLVDKRAALFAATGFSPERIRLPEEGFWPPGLRNVA
jgi:hypothetical protein